MLCKKLEIQAYFEASASENVNVDELFFTIALKAHEIEQTAREDNPYIMADNYQISEKIRGRTSTNLQMENY